MVALVYTEEVPGSTPLQHTDTKTEPPTSIHLEANDTNVDLSNIKPAYCYGDTDIPVFTPTIEEFKDFKAYCSAIDKYGMKSGIVKVIPPKEWVDASLPLDEKVKTIKIKNPIVQHISGNSGIFRQQNIEKQRTYNIVQWREISEQESHQPPAKRGEIRKKVQRHHHIKHRNKSRIKSPAVSKDEDTSEQRSEHVAVDDQDGYEGFDYRFDDSEFTSERCEELERTYWKTLAYNNPMYGADLPGSLFDDSQKIWNVAHLDNILNNLREELPGVNNAYLYAGLWRSTFAWHLEDMDLYSINYIHFGAPKQWYSISQKDEKKFFQAMKEIWPQEYSNCKEFLRHKTFLVSPAILKQYGITVNKLVHYQNEFVITYPYGYHAGFNYGYNCAESVNFAFDSWMPFGKLAKKCMCIDDAVEINMNQLVRHLNGEYTEDESSSEEDEDDSTPLKSDMDTDHHGVKRKRESSSPTTKRKIQKKIKEKTKTPEIINENVPRYHQYHASPVGVLQCQLCPSIYPPEKLARFKQFDLIPSFESRHLKHKQFAHRICCEFTPHTIIEKDDHGGEYVLNLTKAIENRKKTARCTYCRSLRGVCVECGHKKCGRSYHAICALQSGAQLTSIYDLDYQFQLSSQIEEKEQVRRESSQDSEPQYTRGSHLCRFHRIKKVDPDLFFFDEWSVNWANGLLPGELIQIQHAHDKSMIEGANTNTDIIITGEVTNNNFISKEITIEPLYDIDNNGKNLTVSWKYLLVPRIEPANLPPEVLKKKKKTEKKSQHTLPLEPDENQIVFSKIKDPRMEKYIEHEQGSSMRWAHEYLNINLTKLLKGAGLPQPSSFSSFWYYLSDKSTDQVARFSDDPNGTNPNDPIYFKSLKRKHGAQKQKEEIKRINTVKQHRVVPTSQMHGNTLLPPEPLINRNNTPYSVNTSLPINQQFTQDIPIPQQFQRLHTHTFSPIQPNTIQRPIMGSFKTLNLNNVPKHLRFHHYQPPLS